MSLCFSCLNNYQNCRCKVTPIISIRVWRMLPYGNICHISKLFGIVYKQVYSKYFADTEELLGVDGRFVVEPLEGAAVNVQLVGEPLVGAALTAQLVADKMAYVYLHSDCCLCAWLPIPYTNSDDRRQKKKASNLVSTLRPSKNTLGNRQNARFSRAFAHLSFPNDLLKFSTFQCGRDK